MYRGLALFFMTLDHIAYFFYALIPMELYQVFRALGRLAFPLFCYALAQGFRHTRSAPRYLARLLGFALLTQALWTLVSRLTGFPIFTNVLFTLAYALLLLMGLEALRHRQWVLGLCEIALALGLTYVQRPDYAFIGLAQVVLLYVLRGPLVQGLAMSALSLLSLHPLAPLSGLAVLFFPLESRPPSRLVRVTTYLYYPLHVAALILLRTVLE